VSAALAVLWFILGLIFAYGDTADLPIYFAYGAGIFFTGVHIIVTAIQKTGAKK
jgi:hypothetical protein